jgi:NADH-quinone oxidoreductase subunit L
LTVFSAVWIAGALAIAYLIYRNEKLVANTFIEQGYKLDTFYQITFANATQKLAQAVDFTDRKIIDTTLHASAYGHVVFAHLIGAIDKFLIDGSVRFFAGIVRWIGGVARSYQTGKIQDYILYAILALIIFLIWAL